MVSRRQWRERRVGHRRALHGRHALFVVGVGRHRVIALTNGQQAHDAAGLAPLLCRTRPGGTRSPAQANCKPTGAVQVPGNQCTTDAASFALACASAGARQPSLRSTACAPSASAPFAFGLRPAYGTTAVLAISQTDNHHAMAKLALYCTRSRPHLGPSPAHNPRTSYTYWDR